MGIMTTAEQVQLMDKFTEKEYGGIVPFPPIYGYDQPSRSQRRPRKSKKAIDEDEIFVALVVDPETRKISKRSSSCLRHCRDEVLDKAWQKLFPHVQHLSLQNFAGQEPSQEQDQLCENLESPTQLRQRHPMQYQHQRPNKRPRIGPKTEKFDVEQSQRDRSSKPSQGGSERKTHVSFRADATQDWEKWFGDAFRAVQQVSCRIIAKEWIKTIHPKKQSTNPYNGKVPGSRDRGDSERTKPPYWPPDVIHREPDHINKEARTKLLVHLLMNTPHQEVLATGHPNADKEITAFELKESLDKKSDELKAKWQVIEHIIEVRSKLEMYESGGLDASAVINTVDYSDGGRALKAEEDSDDNKDFTDSSKTSEDGSYKEEDQQSTVCEDNNPPQVISSGRSSTSNPSPRRRSSRANHNRPTHPQLHNSRRTMSDQSGMIQTEVPNSMSQSTQNIQLRQTLPLQQVNVEHPMYHRTASLDHNRSMPNIHPPLFPQRDIPPQQFGTPQNHQWSPTNIEMNHSYSHDAIMSEPNMNVIHHSHAPPGPFYPAQMQHNSQFTGVPMQQVESFHGNGHEQTNLPYRSVHYEPYLVHSPQDQEAMRRAFYSI